MLRRDFNDVALMKAALQVTQTSVSLKGTASEGAEKSALLKGTGLPVPQAHAVPVAAFSRWGTFL